jgi:protein subunit release factor A
MKQEKIILEIRASEGGQDSKLLVEDLLNIYLKSARNKGFEYEITDSRNGFCVI